jgi:hypothetical protein
MDARQGGVRRLFEHMREFERRLAAELHDRAVELARLAFLGKDFEHVLGGQGFEIEPVRGIIIRRYRLRIAVDHDRLETHLAQREARMATAIIELDALPDPVRTAAQNDDFFPRGRPRFAGRGRAKGWRVGRIHIGRRRGKFRRASVDPFEHRMHAEVLPQAGHIGFRDASEARETRIGKARRLKHAQVGRVAWQTMRADLGFEIENFLDARDEPRINAADFVNFGR